MAKTLTVKQLTETLTAFDPKLFVITDYGLVITGIKFDENVGKVLLITKVDKKSM